MWSWCHKRHQHVIKDKNNSPLSLLTVLNNKHRLGKRLCYQYLVHKTRPHHKLCCFDFSKKIVHQNNLLMAKCNFPPVPTESNWCQGLFSCGRACWSDFLLLNEDSSSPPTPLTLFSSYASSATSSSAFPPPSFPPLFPFPPPPSPISFPSIIYIQKVGQARTQNNFECSPFFQQFCWDWIADFANLFSYVSCSTLYLRWWVGQWVGGQSFGPA